MEIVHSHSSWHIQSLYIPNSYFPAFIPFSTQGNPTAIMENIAPSNKREYEATEDTVTEGKVLPEQKRAKLVPPEIAKFVKQLAKKAEREI